jgi:hypothetical protein
VFSIDLSSIGSGGTALPGNPGINGVINRTFKFGFIGPGERPVAADMNQDGMEDLGLFVPARDGVPPSEGAEWYFLISGMVENNTPNQPGNDPAVGQLIGPTITGGQYLEDEGPGDFLPEAEYGFEPGTYGRGRIVDDPLLAGPGNIVRFEPTPFGNDRFVQFGDQFALPVLGNFDPPVTITSPGPVDPPSGGDRSPLDVNDDGSISPLDALIVINYLNNGGSSQAPQALSGGPYMDVNADTFISPLDALLVINHLNNPGGGVGEGEAEGEAAADAYFAGMPAYEDGPLLDLLAADAAARRKRR